MESASQVNVPLRSGGKKMRKRRELDALVAHSLAKRANKNNAGNGVHSQDRLLSPSTDEQEDISWPKIVRGSNRSRNRKFSFVRLCAPLIFVTCITLSLGFMYWLYFDLRQQLYEYRQKIEEVSLTSQNLPEALQKWHETSKSLEQNQTIIYSKISDVQHSLDILSADFIHYKTKLDEKKDYSKDEKYVADFGAKIEAVTVDVDRMKERFSEFQKLQDTFKNDIQQLKANFTKVLSKSSLIGNIITTNCSEKINSLSDKVYENIKQLTSNLSVINDTLSQRSQILSDELVTHKKHLDELLERSANTTSHVTSIEDDWTKYKEKVSAWEAARIKFDDEISGLKNTSAYLESSVRDIRTNCNKYHFEMIQNLEKLKETKSEENKEEKIKSKEENQSPAAIKEDKLFTAMIANETLVEPKSNVTSEQIISMR